MESFLKNFLEPLSYFIYTVVFFLKLSRGSSFKEKVLFIYYLLATILLTDASLLVVRTPMYVDNNWLYNIFYLITICVLSYYFYFLLHSKIKKNVIIFLLIVNVLLFIIYDIIFTGFYRTFNANVYSICALSIVIYALLYFDQLLRNVSDVNILLRFDFWLVAAYLFYFLGGFVIVLYYTTLPVDQRGPVWSILNTILFLSSLILLTGYLRIHYRKKHL